MTEAAVKQAHWQFTTGTERFHPTLYWAIREVGLKARPESYLEIGVRDGNSLLTMLGVSYPWLKHLYLCDPWGVSYGGSGRGGPEHIMAMLEYMQFAGEVHFFNGSSQELLPKLTFSEPFLDVALVDGDHSELIAKADLEVIWPMLKPNGYLIFDDVIHPDHPYLLEVGRRFAEHNGATIFSEDLKDSSGVIVLHKG